MSGKTTIAKITIIRRKLASKRFVYGPMQYTTHHMTIDRQAALSLAYYHSLGTVIDVVCATIKVFMTRAKAYFAEQAEDDPCLETGHT